MDKSMQRKVRGELIVISGPSGVGKGTICKALVEGNDNRCFSVSATTRAPRPGEIDGKHYHFINKAEFERMIAGGELLEYMEVFGMNYYGTPKRYVDAALDEGRDVLLDIDVNGAMNVKKAKPEAITVFIAPPSMRALKDRLIGRGTETPEQIEKRYGKAREEMSYIPEYDYVVVNDELECAISDVECILRAERLRTKRCPKLDEILKED